MSQLYVVAYTGPHKEIMIPVDHDYYEVSVSGAKEAGELLIDLVAPHVVTPKMVLTGTAEEIAALSKREVVYGEFTFMVIPE